MKKSGLIFTLICCSLLLPGQEKRSLEREARMIADQVVKDNIRGFIDPQTGIVYKHVDQLPEKGMDVKLLSRYSHFYYFNGVINIAMADLGDVLDEPRYVDYTLNTVEFIFDNASYFKDRVGKKKPRRSPFSRFYEINELDDCGTMAASIIDAYFHRESMEYLRYLNDAASFVMEDMTRLEDGTFARPEPVPMSIWADDLYMSVPFIARMGKLSGETRYYNEALRQINLFDSYLWDEQTGLYFHSWHSDEQANGVARWGRANGWVMMAKVEVLKVLPTEYPGRQVLIESLVRQIKGVARYQSPSGLWHQLLDKNDSFLETSCTAMFSFGTAYAVNQGLIPERYIDIALKGWEGISGRIHTYNKVSVDGICSGTGIGNNLEYYYSRETNANDVGFGAVISAATELILYKQGRGAK